MAVLHGLEIPYLLGHTAVSKVAFWSLKLSIINRSVKGPLYVTLPVQGGSEYFQWIRLGLHNFLPSPTVTVNKRLLFVSKTHGSVQSVGQVLRFLLVCIILEFFVYLSEVSGFMLPLVDSLYLIETCYWTE